jgi:hypothetical protein
MMFEMILYIITLLASLSVVQMAGANGVLNGAFQRGFAGLSTQIVSSKFLLSYTNFETFLRACLEGQIGVFGYLFLGSFAVLIIVWVNNLIEYEVAIV